MYDFNCYTCPISIVDVLEHQFSNPPFIEGEWVPIFFLLNQSESFAVSENVIRLVILESKN